MHRILLIALFALFSNIAAAWQPTKPVTVIFPNGPGAGNEISFTILVVQVAVAMVIQKTTLLLAELQTPAEVAAEGSPESPAWPPVSTTRSKCCSSVLPRVGQRPPMTWCVGGELPSAAPREASDHKR